MTSAQGQIDNFLLTKFFRLLVNLQLDPFCCVEPKSQNDPIIKKKTKTPTGVEGYNNGIKFICGLQVSLDFLSRPLLKKQCTNIVREINQRID